MKKAAMREKMLASVRTRISHSGVNAIRARDVALDCRCAVGVIYNIFEDLEDLILTVSGEYFAELDTLIASHAGYLCEETAEENMMRLARAYYEYARDNPREWGAIFYFRIDMALHIPEWHGKYMPRLLGYIERPIETLAPNTSKSELNRLSRTIFSSMHGLCALSLKGYRSGVNEKEMAKSIEFLVQGFCAQISREAKQLQSA